MFITVNGEAVSLREELSLKELVAFLHLEQPDYVTLLLNDRLVYPSEHGTTIVKDGDTVEYLYYMGGGQP